MHDYTENERKYGGFSPEIEKNVKKNSDVFDIGCSTGELAKALSSKGCTVVGLDIDSNSLQQAKRYCIEIIHCDLDDFEKLDEHLGSRKFDHITLGDIVEHLKYPEYLIKYLRKYLKPEGSLITSIPNAAFISMRIKFLMGNFNYDKNGGLMDEDHLRFFSFKTAKKLFIASGYHISRCYGKSTVRPLFCFLNPLASIFPTLFAIHIIIIAKS